MSLTRTSGQTGFNEVFAKHRHRCDCGIEFKSIGQWMEHVPWCEAFEWDCPPLEQVQDCPRFEAIPTPHDMNRIEALDFAARLAITSLLLLEGKPLGNVHNQIREGRGFTIS